MEKKFQKKYPNRARFMASSLSNLFYNLSKGLYRTKFKLEYDTKKSGTCGNKCNYCSCFLQYRNLKNDLIEYPCLSCNKSYQRKFDS